MRRIYKILGAEEWRTAEATGVFLGSPVDLGDGYIHFSAADQAPETAAKWFAAREDLMLVAVEASALGAALKWEVSRNGLLFPHLYAKLALSEVAWAKPLPLGPGGRHVFPDLKS